MLKSIIAIFSFVGLIQAGTPDQDFLVDMARELFKKSATGIPATFEGNWSCVKYKALRGAVSEYNNEQSFFNFVNVNGVALHNFGEMNVLHWVMDEKGLYAEVEGLTFRVKGKEVLRPRAYKGLMIVEHTVQKDARYIGVSSLVSKSGEVNAYYVCH